MALEQILAVHQSEAYGSGRGAYIHQVNSSFELVMTCFVEEVTETQRSGGFPGKVGRKASGGVSEHTNYRIQFLASALQVRASHDEISGVEGGGCAEEHTIFVIPIFMFTVRVRWRL